MKKRKLILKKKNLSIFVLIILIFISLVVILYKCLNRQVNNYNNKDNNYRTYENDFIKYSFYNSNYYNRYIKYKRNNPDVSLKDVIIRVNIGIDNKYYTKTRKSPYLNKNYILVNKYLYLDENYVPDNLVSISLKYSRSGMMLVKEANTYYEKMCDDALKEGFTIFATSSYRDYQYQTKLYDDYALNDGVEVADTYSARAGFSEHQTGLAVDVNDGNSLYTEFEKTDSFNWMKKNSYKYGFILRFGKGSEELTGYQYEAWHYRYVGVDIAKYIHKHNITFEEYYVQFIEKKS